MSAKRSNPKSIANLPHELIHEITKSTKNGIRAEQSLYGPNANYVLNKNNMSSFRTALGKKGKFLLDNNTRNLIKNTIGPDIAARTFERGVHELKSQIRKKYVTDGDIDYMINHFDATLANPRPHLFQAGANPIESTLYTVSVHLIAGLSTTIPGLDAGYMLGNAIWGRQSSFEIPLLKIPIGSIPHIKTEILGGLSAMTAGVAGGAIIPPLVSLVTRKLAKEIRGLSTSVKRAIAISAIQSSIPKSTLNNRLINTVNRTMQTASNTRYSKLTGRKLNTLRSLKNQQNELHALYGGTRSNIHRQGIETAFL